MLQFPGSPPAALVPSGLNFDDFGSLPCVFIMPSRDYMSFIFFSDGAFLY